MVSLAFLLRNVEAIEASGDIRIIRQELAVSVMLSSLVRRGICPNFVATRGVFSCPYEPPVGVWGTKENRYPRGKSYVSPKHKRKLKEPKKRGHFQYIRMELCDEGDAEEFMKRQPDQILPSDEARLILFQIAFALHASADRYSLKHYDVKLLNIFLKRANPAKSGDVVLRYGVGQHTFALRARADRALIAKLADYGTANVEAASNGQPVTIAQFTTTENTPPDFMIFGDKATQGHGHDCFGLGLCMLHLFTGHAPYEEILAEVTCPSNLKNKLRQLWEDEKVSEYSAIRSVVLADVYKDSDGHIVEGSPDETLYDTFYRFLVLFGLPRDPSRFQGSKVWHAVKEALEEHSGPACSPKPTQRTLRARRNKESNEKPNDVRRFCRDRKRYSLTHGNNKYIARARKRLEVCPLFFLVFLDVLNFDVLIFTFRVSGDGGRLEPAGVSSCLRPATKSQCVGRFKLNIHVSPD